MRERLVELFMPSYANETHHIYLLSSVRKRKLTETRKTNHVRVSVYVLCFVTAGEGIVVLDGALRKIRPFQLYLLVPGMTIELPEHAVSIEFYAISFEPILLEGGAGAYTAQSSLAGVLSPGLVEIRHPQLIFQQMAQLYRESKLEATKAAPALRIRLEQLILSIAGHEAGMPSAARDERVERSIAYMERHYMEKLSVEQLAAAAGAMPTVAFSQLFRHETGMPPVEFLSQLRMNRAKQLLNSKSSRVKEVAAAVGFRSEFYFSRMFQRAVGVPPTLYMKRKHLRVAVASSLTFGDHLRSLGIEPVCEVDLFPYPGHSPELYIRLLEQQLSELEQSKPDFIIADHYHTDFKEQFKRTAAPVYMDFSVWDWKRNFERIAELVDREREASEMLTRLYVLIETAGLTLRRRLGKERVTLIQVSHRAVGIQGKEHHPLNELVYGELGLEPGGQVPVELWRLELQPEELPVLDSEHLFIHHHHVLAGSERIYEKLTATAAWPQIPAVREGRAVRIPNWFVMSWTPLGRERIVNELLAALAQEQHGADRRYPE